MILLKGKKNPKKERERTHGQPLVHAQLQIEHVGPGGAKKRKIKRSIVPPSIN